MFLSGEKPRELSLAGVMIINLAMSVMQVEARTLEKMQSELASSASSSTGASECSGKAKAASYLGQSNSKSELDKSNSDALRLANVSRLYAKYERLGIGAMKKGDFETAIQMLGQAAQEAEILKMDNADYSGCLQLLAVAYEKVGKTKDSIQCQQKALDILSRSGNGDEKSRLDAAVRMAAIYSESGDQKSALENLQNVLKDAEARGLDDATKCGIMENLISFCFDKGDLPAAKTYLEKVKAYDDRRPFDQNSARHLEQMARIYWKEGKLDEARNILGQSLQLRSSLKGIEQSGELTALLRNLISANLTLGAYDEPEKDIAAVLSYDRLHLAPDSPDYLFDLLSLASIKLHKGEASAAQFLCQEVLKSQKDSQQDTNNDSAQAYSLLAQIAENQKQWRDARSYARQAIEIRQKFSAPEALSLRERGILNRAEAALLAVEKTADGSLNKISGTRNKISR